MTRIENTGGNITFTVTKSTVQQFALPPIKRWTIMKSERGIISIVIRAVSKGGRQDVTLHPFKEYKSPIIKWIFVTIIKIKTYLRII